MEGETAMVNGVVIYEVVSAENAILLREAERQNRLKAGQLKTDGRESTLGRAFHRLRASIRGEQQDCNDQTAFREQLAGC